MNRNRNSRFRRQPDRETKGRRDDYRDNKYVPEKPRFVNDATARRRRKGGAR